MAAFFFSCSVPFRAVENKYFLNFVRLLCEINFNYKPPCRKTIAGSVLHDVYKDVQEEKKQLLKDTDSVILVDGWRNKSVNRKFLVFSIRNINVDQTFLTFFDTSLEREDGETLATNIERAIQFAKDEYKTNVFAIITDNDSKIVCGARLARNNDIKLWQTTCSSHSGNLLLKSCITDDLVRRVRDVITAFSDPKLDCLLNRFGATKLKNFPDTRFCFFRDSCQSVLKNLKHLKEASMIEDVNVPEKIFEDIWSNEFENVLTETINNLNPICKLINKCQHPKVSAADATQYWLSLQLPVDDFNMFLRMRIKKAIYPASYAANFLHPKYKGLLLNREEMELCNSFLREIMDQKCSQELESFIQNRQRFDALAEKCLNPISFWALCSFKLPNLARLSTKLMLMPGATALIESYFSNWTYVHNLYRNRLNHTRSGQLADIYHSLKFINIKYDLPKNDAHRKRKSSQENDIIYDN